MAGGVAVMWIITGASQYTVAILLFVLAAIWWFLFLNPKSPVKKCWWSIPDKLMFVIPQELGYKPTVNKEIISVWVNITAPSGIMVNKIDLKITQKEGIPSFEWKSHEVIAREHKYLDFKRPSWLSTGEYKAKLIAYTPEGYSKSGEFILEVTI